MQLGGRHLSAGQTAQQKWNMCGARLSRARLQATCQKRLMEDGTAWARQQLSTAAVATLRCLVSFRLEQPSLLPPVHALPTVCRARQTQKEWQQQEGSHR